MARAKDYFPPSHFILRKWRLKKMKATALIAIVDSDPVRGGLQAHVRGNRRNSSGKTVPYQPKLF